MEHNLFYDLNFVLLTRYIVHYKHYTADEISLSCDKNKCHVKKKKKTWFYLIYFLSVLSQTMASFLMNGIRRSGLTSNFGNKKT